MDFDYSFYKMMYSKAKASVLLLLEESHDQPLNQDKCIDVIA
jgi:hypothetical protein